MSEILNFPGSGKNITGEGEKELTAEEVVKQVMEEHKFKTIVIVGIPESGEGVVITGNSTITQGVFLMEVGKSILINAIE